MAIPKRSYRLVLGRTRRGAEYLVIEGRGLRLHMPIDDRTPPVFRQAILKGERAVAMRFEDLFRLAVQQLRSIAEDLAAEAGLEETKP